MTTFKQHPRPFPETAVWRAIGVRAIDGDTISVLVDCGFGVSVTVDLRLEGVDTPEVVGENRAAGLAAKEFTASLIEGRALVVTTRKFRQSFTRYVARVEYWQNNDGVWRDLAEALVEAGHAREAA